MRTSGEFHRSSTRVEEQTASLRSAVRELENFSARMEVVASNSEQVSTAASQAHETAAQGPEFGEEAMESAETLGETGDDIIEELTGMIADVEQLATAAHDASEQIVERAEGQRQAAQKLADSVGTLTGEH